jgi:hypothetical protein
LTFQNESLKASGLLATKLEQSPLEAQLLELHTLPAQSPQKVVSKIYIKTTVSCAHFVRISLR